MMVVDTSALMAVLFDEPQASHCRKALELERDVIMSAGTFAEAAIVAVGRGVEAELTRLVESLPIEVIPVTAASAARVARAYHRWGKGFHPASLNFGDCFAYELAASRSCPLLFIGVDFSQTDIASVL